MQQYVQRNENICCFKYLLLPLRSITCNYRYKHINLISFLSKSLSQMNKAKIYFHKNMTGTYTL